MIDTCASISRIRVDDSSYIRGLCGIKNGECAFAGQKYHFIFVTVKHKHSTAMLGGHEDISTSDANLDIALLSRCHDEAAGWLQQLVQHSPV